MQTLKGSGPGGQHRNKRETGIRFTHIPTGVTAAATRSRKQKDNKAAAWVKLISKLALFYMRDELSQKGVEVASHVRIRTYHERRGRVKDHRTQKEGDYWDVLDGNIDCLR
jgi:peptide chain release factor 2